MKAFLRLLGCGIALFCLLLSSSTLTAEDSSSHVYNRGFAQTPFTVRDDEFAQDQAGVTAKKDSSVVDTSKKVNMYSAELYNSKRNKKNRTLVNSDQAVDRFAVPIQDQLPPVVGQVD